jgi:hypothetical protein
MKRMLLARVARLEAMPETGKIPFFRYGWLHPFPDDYAGERHVAMVTSEPTNNPKVEWCVFEERPGKAPCSDTLDGVTVYLTESTPDQERRASP